MIVLVGRTKDQIESAIVDGLVSDGYLDRSGGNLEWSVGAVTDLGIDSRLQYKDYTPSDVVGHNGKDSTSDVIFALKKLESMSLVDVVHNPPALRALRRSVELPIRRLRLSVYNARNKILEEDGHLRSLYGRS